VLKTCCLMRRRRVLGLHSAFLIAILASALLRSRVPSLAMAPLTVLVTGGSGCVGSGVVRALVKRGHRVLALSRSERSAEKLRVLGAESVPGDLAQLDWQEAVARSQAVVHCGLDWSAPPEASRRVLDWLLAQAEGKTLISTGGTWLFGPGRFTEEAPLQRGHGWDWLIDEVEAVQQSKHLRGIVVHPPLVYNWCAESGESSGWLSRMIQELKTSGSVRVVGSEGRRQAVGHSDDIGEVYALALERGRAGQSYNAGATSTTAGAMARSAAKLAGVSSPRLEVLDLKAAAEVFGASAFGMDLDQVMLSPASEALGWQPQHMNLPGEA